MHPRQNMNILHLYRGVTQSMGIPALFVYYAICYFKMNYNSLLINNIHWM